MNKKNFITVLSCCAFSMFTFGQQEVKSQTETNRALSMEKGALVNTVGKQEMQEIPLEMKHQPEEFFLINDKPVSKQEYLEYLRKQNENLEK